MYICILTIKAFDTPFTRFTSMPPCSGNHLTAKLNVVDQSTLLTSRPNHFKRAFPPVAAQIPFA